MNASATTVILYSTIEEYAERPGVLGTVILDLPVGTVGKVQTVEIYRDGSRALVTETVEVTKNNGKGWYGSRVTATDSEYGITRAHRLIWGAELVTA